MTYPQKQTLQEFLLSEVMRHGGTDFSLRVSSMGDKLRFYVYSTRFDGQTADFELQGNALVTTAVTDYAHLARAPGLVVR